MLEMKQFWKIKSQSTFVVTFLYFLPASLYHFPRRSPSLSLTVIMAVVFCWFSAWIFFFFAGINFSKYRAVPAIPSLAAFGSWILLPDFMHLTQHCQETYSGQHVNSPYFYCISSSASVKVRLLVSNCSTSHLSVFTWVDDTLDFLKI